MADPNEWGSNLPENVPRRELRCEESGAVVADLDEVITLEPAARGQCKGSNPPAGLTITSRTLTHRQCLRLAILEHTGRKDSSAADPGFQKSASMFRLGRLDNGEGPS